MYYTEAYKVFETLSDELFMLLTSRLIVELCKSRGYNNEHFKAYQTTFESIKRLPTFKDVNLDLLFENFDQRLNLARQVVFSQKITEGLQNVEATFRDDQFKNGGSPGRDIGIIDQANSEMNLVWKQAVKLSLKRSINSARLMINNDKELNKQKRDQLIVVKYIDRSPLAKFKRCLSTSKRSTTLSFWRR